MSEKNIDEILDNEQNMENENKKKVNKRILKLIALIGSGIILFGAIIVACIFGGKKQNNSKKESNTATTTSSSTYDLDSLGSELSFPTSKKTEYTVLSGNLDENKLTEDSKGKIWKDETAKSKASNVGKTSIDLQNGSLVTKTNGSVYTKETSVVIVEKETGKTLVNEDINDYVYDKDRKEYVAKEELGKYIYSEYNFYDNNGNLAIQKGDLVSKTDYSKALKTYITKKPTTTTTTTTKPTTTTTQSSKVNQDGTYSAFGLVFKDKQTFEAWLLDDNAEENYGIYKGVVYPQTEIEEMTTSKTLVK